MFRRTSIDSSIRATTPSNELIVKLKADVPTRRALQHLVLAEGTGDRTFAAAVPREAAFVPSTSALEMLVLSGAIESVEPLFDSPGIRRAAGSERLAFAVEPSGVGEEDTLHILTFRDEDAAEHACAALQQDAKVEYVHRPAERYLMSPGGVGAKKGARKRSRSRRRTTGRLDPLESRQWGLGAVRWYDAQKLSTFKDARDVTIAVIDTGVDAKHPDLQGVVVEEKSFTTGPLKDTKGHGTHVIGILAAVRHQQIGISGICASRRILSLKALGPYSGVGYYRAIRYAIDQKVSVLNLSLGGPHDPTEEILIRAAIDSGMVVVAAMGNEFRAGNAPSYPAALPDVIAVGASTEIDRRASFSNTGPHITLVAPGENILSTVPTYASELAESTDYDAWPGTSMATPFVAATAALIRARRPKTKVGDVRNALVKGADKVSGQSGFTEELGHGRLNVRRSL